MTARLFYLTLPSGRTVFIAAFTLGELVDVVLAHYPTVGEGLARDAWDPETLMNKLGYGGDLLKEKRL